MNNSFVPALPGCNAGNMAATPAPDLVPAWPGYDASLRSTDPQLIDAVSTLAQLAGCRLQVLPASAGLPPHGIALDGLHADESGPTWEFVPGRNVLALRSQSWVTSGPTPARHLPELTLPAQESQLLSIFAGVQGQATAAIVAVSGSCGGVGATTWAALLARAFYQLGQATALISLDTRACGLEFCLGIERVPGLRWADLTPEETTFNAQKFTASLPQWQGVLVLAGDKRGAAPGGQPVVNAAVLALARCHAVLVVDLPLPSGQWLLPQVKAHFICSTLSMRAITASWGLAKLLPTSHPVQLVCRGQGTELSATELARGLHWPLAAQLVECRRLERHCASGVGPPTRGSLARAATRVAKGLL